MAHGHARVHRPGHSGSYPGALEPRSEIDTGRRERPDTPAAGLVERAKGVLPLLRRRLDAAKKQARENSRISQLKIDRLRRNPRADLSAMQGEVVEDTVHVLMGEIRACEELIEHGVPGWDEIELHVREYRETIREGTERRHQRHREKIRAIRQREAM